MRRWAVLTAFWAVSLAAAPAWPQTPQAPPPAGPPDVLVLVYQQTGKGDLVDITYAHTVPHAQAQRDLDALAHASGWAVGPGRVTDGRPPVQSKIGPMTSSVLTIPRVIQDGTRTLPVAPFVTAFRSYKRLTLIFSVGPDFPFQGPSAYADNNVQIAFKAHHPVYTYQIRVLNSQFAGLNLPQSQVTAASSGHHASPVLILLGVLLAALAAGGSVYFLMTRAVPTAAAKDDALSEEQTTLGPKG